MRDELWVIHDDELQSFLIESLVYAGGPAAVSTGSLRERCVAALTSIKPAVGVDASSGPTVDA
jgi:hypothetical protein